MTDKRVDIIWTGATAIQVVPHLGEHSKHLYAFQRTPSSINVRLDQPPDPEWIMVNAKMVAETKKAADPVALTQMIQKETQTANFKKMGQIRRRVDATVKDRQGPQERRSS
ncbi:uncharacterized protein FRV6_13021 [Fusarium oxysporum]|uniref:Uncharacterized protein n=1 Tax=Fusarium oxysporum TaxID=5507 RepID=A0A2H3TJS2_FUSOX|nr:uncharacterized protein FRV6_13021 [Fusarium oxysporum]